MKKVLTPFILFALLVLVGSCSSSKKVAYFQNIDTISLAASRGLYDARIMPKDQLTITVLTTNPEVSAPFNLLVSGTVGVNGQMSGSSGRLQNYLVDNDGNINFPIIGTLHVAGKTKTECEAMIKEKVMPYLNANENPIVTVRMSSYRVTVIGEVGSPSVIPVSTEKMSIIEALASAGDLGIYGKRTNVLLIREDATGEKHAVRINLNDANLFNSPYYYLQQNDIVYVEPNSVKAKNSAIGSSTTLWFSVVGLVTSLASLVINILR
jgi:polysaccharide export outer membrane protein